MVKEDPYRVKFHKLNPWLIDIFHAVKKELKNDHMLKSPSFIQKHFPKRALDKLSNEEFTAAYQKEIDEGDEDLGEKVAAHWVMKNGEIYQFFATELGKINPKFDEIESFSSETSAFLLSSAISQFGASRTYVFCIINAVVFSEESFQKLRELAIAEKEVKIAKEPDKDFETLEGARERHAKEIRKLVEKYEKRMEGIERKYAQDVFGLKKQISNLHKKLGEKGIAV